MYYVYELRKENGEVFYVGKGTRSRITFHEWAARNGWEGHLYNAIRKILKSGQRVIREKVAEGLTNEQAVELERMLIAKHGKKSLGGTLVNITDGGDGAPGYKHDLVALMKMRVAWKPRQISEETRQRVAAMARGRRMSEEAKEKLRRSISGAGHWNYGKTISKEHAERMHAAVRKPVLVNGVRYESISSAAAAHGIKPNSALYRITRGKNRGGYGQWQWV